MDLGLKGKNALVTGGSTGLGLAVVKELAGEGANVALSAHLTRTEDLIAPCEQLGADQGVRIVPIHADLEDVTCARDLYGTAAEALGGIDVLVNNAGIWLSGKVREIGYEDWDRTLDVNLRAPFLLCQSFIRAHERERRGGHVVNVTSQAAFHGSTTGHAHYAASKAGLVAFSISMAREVARYGINVNCVAVGLMRSKMTRDAIEKNPDYYTSRVPLGRLADPCEIARVVAFLASDRASYMTGATVDVSGGMLMR